MQRFLLAAIALLAGAPASWAQDTAPLWELGLGGFGYYGPDYPAAGESRLNALPFPYLRYRGEFLRIDDAAARLVPVETPRYSFGLSASGAFPANSDDNAARRGMPDLDFLAELGPELVINGPRFADGRGEIDLALQGRAVFSVSDNAVGYEGAVFEPELRGSLRGVLGGSGEMWATMGATFATEGVQDYFYQVDPIFSTPGRPSFDAEAGYLGSYVSLALSRDLGSRTRIFGGASVSFHGGAANRNSPLFRETVTTSVGIGLVYTFARSTTQVPRRR